MTVHDLLEELMRINIGLMKFPLACFVSLRLIGDRWVCTIKPELFTRPGGIGYIP